MGVEGPAGGDPTRLIGTTPHRRLAAPCHGGENAAYARRRRHPLRHVYAKRSPQLGSWAGRAGRFGRDAGSAWHVPRGYVPLQARPAGVRAGWAEARTCLTGPTCEEERRTGPTCEEERRRRRQGAGRKWRETRNRRYERRGDGQKPAVSARGWGRGAAGEASAVLKIEGTNELERSAARLERR